MKSLRFVCLLLVWLYSSVALAGVERYALLIGNNRGRESDVALRYAEFDAAKVSKVLKELGGFEPVNVVLLQGESADVARKTLVSLNDRIRAARTLPGTEALLFVYYSGHADGQSLRLGKSDFELRELGQLVRGSSARFRLLVVDACRAGTLTRSKGGRIVPPFNLTEESLGGEGLAFLTASAQEEDAQESDEIRGSFFTHAFVSGLLGAADRNGDGSIVLDEAYSYAYDATLRATSRTFAGTQHPTFQFETRGQGLLVLTRPVEATAFRARLVFPRGADYLVMAENERGAVVGEISANGQSRSLSLPPGTYFLRGRAVDHLQEGLVKLIAGEQHQIMPKELERVEFARLVRKGQSERAVAHSPELGLLLRAGFNRKLPNCIGALIGNRIDFPSMGLRSRFSYCHHRFENSALSAKVHELGLDFSVDHTWDFTRLSLYSGIGVGGMLTHQHFNSHGSAPNRWSSSGLGFVIVGATLPLSRRLYLGSDLSLEGHLLRYQETAYTRPELALAPASRFALYTGMQF